VHKGEIQLAVVSHAIPAPLRCPVNVRQSWPRALKSLSLLSSTKLNHIIQCGNGLRALTLCRH
jgi:hypothetical protein